MPKLFITGCNGLLGANAVVEAADRFRVVACGRSAPRSFRQVDHLTFDIRDERATLDAVLSTAPDVILHCAAETRVDYCEDHTEHARQVNALGVRHLAMGAVLAGALFVYISTDSVFDGQRGHYSEDDAPNPINVYAETKLAGEREVRDLCSDHLILRTNMFGWNMPPKQSLSEWVLNGVQSGKVINGFTDITFSPLLTNHVARVALELVERHARGTYHLGAHDRISKFEFARSLCRVFGLDPGAVHPVTSEAVRLKAPRPKSTDLEVAKVEHFLGRRMPTISNELRALRFLEESGYVDSLRSSRELQCQGIPYEP